MYLLHDVNKPKGGSYESRTQKDGSEEEKRREADVQNNSFIKQGRTHPTVQFPSHRLLLELSPTRGVPGSQHHKLPVPGCVLNPTLKVPGPPSNPGLTGL